MVDFNNETTVGTPAIDIVRVLILQRRADLFEAWEDYKKKSYAGIEKNTPIIRARLFTLFMEIQAAQKRRLKDEDYLELIRKVKSDNIEELETVTFEINEFLDSIKLITVDTKKTYDSTRVEVEDKMKKL